MAAKGESTRQKIVDDAARLFHRNGFGATSVHDILEATGLTKGSLYFHFRGKEELALAVLARAHAEFMAFLDAALAGDDPGAALARFFDEAIALHRRRGFVGGCLFGNTALEASDAESPYAAAVAGTFAAWKQKLGAVIDRAQERGQVRADLPATQLAETVVALLEGAIMQARLHKSEEPMRQSVAALARMLALRPEMNDNAKRH